MLRRHLGLGLRSHSGLFSLLGCLKGRLGCPLPLLGCCHRQDWFGGVLAPITQLVRRRDAREPMSLRDKVCRGTAPITIVSIAIIVGRARMTLVLVALVTRTSPSAEAQRQRSRPCVLLSTRRFVTAKQHL